MSTIESSSYPPPGLSIPQTDSGNVQRLLGLLRQSLPSPEHANRIGKYYVLDVLRDTGHTFVFKAVDTVLNREIVLKFYKPGSSNEQDVVAEGRALSRTDNPHVVKAYGVEQTKGLSFLVLEKIDGITLGKFCEHQVLSESRALQLATQILEGMAEVHRNGLLHLDLKPDNVMINPETFKATIIDFGLARRINEVSHNEIFGTRGFVAPERINNQPGLVDQTTDIFGVGGILFFLLTGDAPFKIGDDNVDSSTLTPQLNLLKCSRGFRNLIVDCLAEDKSLRPQDCQSMLRRVETINLVKKIKTAGLATIILLACCWMVLNSFGVPGVNLLGDSLDSKVPTAVDGSSEIAVPGTEASVLSNIPINNIELDRISKVHKQIRNLRHHIDKSCRSANFVHARKYQLRLFDFVTRRWPNAKLIQQVEWREFEIFDEFSQYDLVEQQALSDIYTFKFEAYDLSSSGETVASVEQMKLALDSCISTLGEKHGLTAIINGEVLRLKLNLGPVDVTEYQNSTRILREFYGTDSRREAEIHYAMGVSILNELSKTEESIDRDLFASATIFIQTRAVEVLFEKAIKMMDRYSMGHVDRELAYLLSAACLKRDKLNDRRGSKRLIEQAKTICQKEFGFQFGSGIRTLVNVAEQQEFEGNFEESKATLMLAKKYSMEKFMSDSSKYKSTDSRLLSLRSYCDKCEISLDRIEQKMRANDSHD